MLAGHRHARWPMTDEQLEAALANWASWCRWRCAWGQAASMEGNFRSPQHWEALPVTRPPALDLEAAARLELAVCALSLRDHSLLRYWYVEKWRPEMVCRCVKKASGETIRFGAFDAAVVEAKRMLLHELELPAAVRKERALARVLAIKLAFEPDKG